MPKAVRIAIYRMPGANIYARSNSTASWIWWNKLFFPTYWNWSIL